MNEYTKGFLMQEQAAENAIDILSKRDGYSVVASIVACDEDELSGTQRANATELVRRWNAFEEGGLVEDLVNECKKAMLDIAEASIKFERKHHKIGQEWLEQAIHRLEAALAKAGKE